MFEDGKEDRRQRYSFRRHFNRLAVSGRLRKVGLATIALLVVAGITFARCQSSRITGPSAGPSGPSGPAPSLSTTSSGQKDAIGVFPASLLPAVHPCLPDVTFVEMSGEKNITYSDEMTTDANGNRSHDVSWNETTAQRGKDKNGKGYGTQKSECPEPSTGTSTDSRGKCHFHFNESGKSFHFQNHQTVKPEGSSAETCTQNATPGGGLSGGGNACPFNSDVTFAYVFAEEPVTNEAVMTVAATNIISSCQMTSLTMLLGVDRSGDLSGQ